MEEGVMSTARIEDAIHRSGGSLSSRGSRGGGGESEKTIYGGVSSYPAIRECRPQLGVPKARRVVDHSRAVRNGEISQRIFPPRVTGSSKLSLPSYANSQQPISQATECFRYGNLRASKSIGLW